MDKNLIKILPYALRYRSHIVWNVLYNILYALFSTLSFIALIPMMQVLFDNAEKITEKPVYTGIFEITKFGKDSLYYYITELTNEYGAQYALLLVVALVISTFLFKNLFNYLASFHIMHLKNGVLRDLRKTMYNKIIELPTRSLQSFSLGHSIKAHFSDNTFNRLPISQFMPEKPSEQRHMYSSGAVFSHVPPLWQGS